MNDLLKLLMEDTQFIDIMTVDILEEMMYEDYTDHFSSRLKSLANEYNKNEKIFKHLSKILKIDIDKLPKFECHTQHSGERQISFSLINQDADWEIRANYERYLKDMINTLKKELKDFPAVTNIWTADGEGIIYINLKSE